MIDWKSQLRAVLKGLLRTHATAPLSEIESILRGVLALDDLSFLDRAGRELRGDMPLQEALNQAARVIARVQCPPPLTGAAESEAREHALAAESRFREGPAPIETADITTDPRFDHFLHEFLRLEQRHDFMWAGYVVRELLPRLGFAPEEAKIVLDRLRAENLVTISKVPNPKNPDFPATGVHLNHEHPRVKALLGQNSYTEQAVVAPVPGSAPAKES